MLKELKTIELEIFKSFIKVCEELNLRYYVVGGTLLGAVRHKGFIPWDDDIDVGMPRKDYEIFLEKGQELLPKEYFLQSIYTDDAYIQNYAKIRDNGTTFIETSAKNLNINHGVFIDVFPLDYCEDTFKYRHIFKPINFFLNLRISSEFYVPNRRAVLKIVSAVLKIIYPSVRKVVLKREKMLKQLENGSLMANYCGAWGEKEIMPAEWYKEGTTLEFEGISVKVPKEYKKWLTQVYGDYMQLPPEEKRVTHHYTEVIDLNKSYLNYTKEK